MDVSRLWNDALDLVIDPFNSNKMPSLRSLWTFGWSAVGSTQIVAGLRSSPARGNMFATSSSATCTNPQLSCHNTTAMQDLCCFNSPGGALLQTQFWDTNPSTGPSNSWTIHGLWPDNCDGTYDANCDSSRAYTNITAILQAAGQSDLVTYMETYWPDYQGNDETFWEHEWAKHGTCISTLDPSCFSNYYPTEEVPPFFERVVSLFKTLPSYEWLSDAGIVPSTSATYTASAIQAALSKNRGGHQVYLGCQNGALDEIWYFFNVAGSVQSGTFEATDPIGASSTCPSTGIKYLPKSGSAAPTTTTSGSSTPTTTTTGSSPTSTGGSFSGSGYLNVNTSGSQDGCIISAGTWYTTGTCATFTATPSGSGFTLKSSKGNCGIVSGVLTCGSSVSSTVFSATGSSLTYGNSDVFYADSVPSGSTQAKVYTSSSHSTSLSITWSGK